MFSRNDLPEISDRDYGPFYSCICRNKRKKLLFSLPLRRESRSYLLTLLHYFLVSVLLLTLYATQLLASVTNYLNCNNCHQGIESAGKGHDFTCTHCHLPGFRRKKLTSHQVIIRNPSSNRWQRKMCQKCHENDINRVRNSLHGTLAGIINQTRYLWGAQQKVLPPVYSANNTLIKIPEGNINLSSPSSLVDNFLRRKCLRCHVSVEGAKVPGLYRASGCAACHAIYDDDGLYKGRDKAIDGSKRGYPRIHGLTKAIPIKQCLHCHNCNHVGSDYVGMFQADFNSTYQRSLGMGIKSNYGVTYLHLAPDIHFKKGLRCVDCHQSTDVMGDNTIHGIAADAVKATCSKCHHGFGNPTFSKITVAHRVKKHRRLRCSACHAQWSFQDYGLSVIITMRPEYKKWKHLMYQGDPYLLTLFKRELFRPYPAPPTTPDTLSGAMKPGMWLAGWRFQRWELMPLGIDQKGKVAILRPQYQYFISSVDPEGTVFLDSAVPTRGDNSGRGWAFNPYSPHTISPLGRNCDSCHKNPVAAGKGIFPDKRWDTYLTVPSVPADPRARLLNREERKFLMNPSNRFKALRLRFLFNGTLSRSSKARF